MSIQLKLNFNNMKPFFLFLMILLFSCKNKELIKSDVKFEIQNKELFEKNILILKLTNNSNKNYFICFDTTNIYYSSGLNYKTNEIVHPRPVFYLHNDSIASEPTFNMIKPKSIDTSQINCIKRNMQIRIDYLNDLKKLKKILIVKSKTTTILKLPFENNYARCNVNYTYLLEKGKYQIQFKYKMNKNYFNEIVDKKFFIELKNKNIEPYYLEIVSNKVPFILE
jgi:hypothetical protein